MASYFDLPTKSPDTTVAAAAALQVPRQQQDEYRGSSLLSPQVSRILDELDLSDGSSSSEEEEDVKSRGKENQGEKQTEKYTTTKTATPTSPQTSPPQPAQKRKSHLAHSLHPDDMPSTPPPAPSSSYVKGAKRPGATVSVSKTKPARHGHMERFKSLRSVLFLSKIQVNMSAAASASAKEQEEHERNDAAQEWKRAHEKRRGYSKHHSHRSNSTTTPTIPPTHREKEKEKDTPNLTSRVALKFRRMTSQSTPMPRITESEPKSGPYNAPRARRDSTASSPSSSSPEEVGAEDVDAQITRWKTHQDPASGTSSRHSSISSPSPTTTSASTSTALNQTDIPSLIQHASRLTIPTRSTVQVTSDGEDEVSTASDDNADADSVSEDGDEDTNELVRWISRRDSKAGGEVGAKEVVV